VPSSELAFGAADLRYLPYLRTGPAGKAIYDVKAGEFSIGHALSFVHLFYAQIAMTAVPLDARPV
jgi:hypothetical protein